MKKYFLQYILLLLPLTFPSCKKYLDAKPDSKLATPTTLADLQSLLDYSNVMNRKAAWSGEGSADNYFLPDDFFATLEPYQRNIYTWSENSVPDGLPNDWSSTYQPIYYANLAVEGIAPIERNEQNKFAWDNIKGSSFFFRGKCLLDAVLLWSSAYDRQTAGTDLGIPIRLTADFNTPSTRASVQANYDQILNDLRESASLLPELPEHATRPSKPAAYALLSRTYLSMQLYDSAGFYADKSLELRGDLLDYNELDLLAEFPFERFNQEVIMHFTMPEEIYWLAYHVDTALYNMYAEDDLRKQAFFRSNGDGTYNCFSSSYAQEYANFTGLATDEMLLTRAECYARSGKLTEAMEDLNTLMRLRWDADSFMPFTAETTEDALVLILQERRKELLLRGVRWPDLKRLNKETHLSTTLTRKVNGELITLLPNHNAYALPIPNNILQTAGLAQNPR